MNSSKFYIVSIPQDKVKDSNLILETSQTKFGSDGYEEFSLDEAQVDEILGEDAFCGGDLTDELMERLESNAGGILKYYFTKKNAHQMAKAFQAWLLENNIKAELEEFEDQDWNETWKQHYEPILLDSFVVLPVWENDSTVGGDREKIIINPGMGFGTGTHETTRQCILSLLDIKEEGQQLSNCLDFGSGSGILGISFQKIYNKKVVFVDIDERAIENNKNNSELNFPKKSDDSEYFLRDKFSVSEQFDLVFANILEPVLLEEFETISDSVKAEKFLIISGILTEQKDSIIKKYSPNFNLKSEKTEGEWMALTFKKK